MRVNKSYFLLAALPALTLAACTANEQIASSRASAAPVTSAQPLPAGGARWGNSVAAMADQYNRPHPGPVAAGASAWVAPAPPPAMVVASLPPATPPAPPPAAVANRQPAPAAAPAAARPAVDAANMVRPEAAAADTPASAPAPAATLSAATREAGRKLFNDYSCGSCHGLADAGAGGSIGPGLDRNPRLTKDYVVDIVKTGRGAMPSFAGQMSDTEIATLAEYIVGVSRK